MNENNAAQPVLTDDEIKAIRDRLGGGFLGPVPFARAIESALLSKLRGSLADEPLGWKICFTDRNGQYKTVLHDHNAVGDYRSIDPMASSIPLGPYSAALASAPVAGEAAWMHEEDQNRVISAQQKAQAERDGGAYASSLRPYTIGLFRHATPQASEAPAAFSKDGVLFWYGDHAARRGFNGDLYLAPQASEAVRDEDVVTLLNFIFERFSAPCKAGDLPGYVVPAIRRLERAALSAQAAQKEQSDAG